MPARQHNEWFRSVSLGNRKSCPCCGERLESGESIWSWGQYIRARWNTIQHFCKKCFPDQVQKELNDHTAGCGCTVNLIGKGEKLPSWLTLETTECEVAAA